MRKQSIVKQLLPIPLQDFLVSHPEFGKIQAPDLLMYDPVTLDWFFCEVKGPRDRLKEKQMQFFNKLNAGITRNPKKGE